MIHGPYNIKPSGNYECRRNLSSETPVLSKGTRDSLPYFVHFCRILIKLNKGVSLKMNGGIANFVQIGGMKVTHYSRGVNEFLSIVSTFIFRFG
jgi:hypothetical protein